MSLRVSNQRVLVDLGPRSYAIEIGEGLLASFCHLLQAARPNWFLAGKVPSALVVTDAGVPARYAELVVAQWVEAGGRAALAIQPQGETAKSLGEIEKLYDQLIGLTADRHTVVIAVGGGVVGDAAGFAAATYARGISFVQVPTTLLAAVDSSVGGKVGVNHRLAKNMIGAFHQPAAVVIDLALLQSLPEREYRAGLAEVVKYGVILDGDFFRFLEANQAAICKRESAALVAVVKRSCELKGLVVEKDEFETSGLRACLNYGHTFGHAIEAIAGYGEILHGEGVAIGMMCAARLAQRLGKIDQSLVDRQHALLTTMGLPTELPATLASQQETLLERMRLDKKSVDGQLRLILPVRLGEVESFGGIPLDAVRGVLSSSDTAS